MRPPYHTAHAYREFDAVMGRVEAWLAPRAAASAGFDSCTIAARLAQRVVELGLAPFVVSRASGPERAVNREIVGRGITIDPVTGAVSMDHRARLAALRAFAVHAGYGIARAARGVFSRRARETRPATIVLGVGAEAIVFAGNDARFVAFCRKGPIAPLRDGAWLLVQSNSAVDASRPDVVGYERLPLHALAERACTVLDVLRLVFATAGAAARLAWQMVRFPVMSLLARDYAYLPLVRVLDRERRIEAIVITNALFDFQPLWMRERPGRSFRVHMVWYAQNVVPLVLAADGLRSDVPNYRHLAVDESWVWTREFVDYLGSIGLACECHVVGPILWYLPSPAQEPRIERDTRSEIRIVVFDVTPVTDEIALQIGIIRNYYTPPNMIRSLDDVVHVAADIEAATGRRVRILLKHKRSYSSNHAPGYIDFVAGLVAPGGAVELVDYQESIYALAIESDFFVVVPYSSPAYVASHVGKRAIFYDAPGWLEPTFLPAPGVSFAPDRAALLAQALEIVSSQPAPAGTRPSAVEAAAEQRR